MISKTPLYELDSFPWTGVGEIKIVLFKFLVTRCQNSARQKLTFLERILGGKFSCLHTGATWEGTAALSPNGHAVYLKALESIQTGRKEPL